MMMTDMAEPNIKNLDLVISLLLDLSSLLVTVFGKCRQISTQQIGMNI